MPTPNIDAFARRLQTFADNYERLGETIVERHSDDIADLQAKQLSQGLNSEGQSIQPEYADSTVKYKERYGVGLGKVTDHVTAFDTGETYSLLKAMVNGGKYSITANTPKFKALEDHYGENLFGLDSVSAAEFRENITVPEVTTAFKEQVLNV